MVSEKFQKIGFIKKIKLILTLELVLLVLWIPCVIFIFKFIQDRRTAGLIAGAGFILIPTYNIYTQLLSQTSMFTRWIRVFASGTFFLISAMPIFLLRIFNWDKSFEDIFLFELLSAQQLHSLSNFLYISMLLVYLTTNAVDAFYLNAYRDIKKK